MRQIATKSAPRALHSAAPAHGGSHSAVPATKGLHGGSESAAPATKSAHGGFTKCCLPRNLHMEVHKVLCLPRNLHVKKQLKLLSQWKLETCKKGWPPHQPSPRPNSKEMASVRPLSPCHKNEFPRKSTACVSPSETQLHLLDLTLEWLESKDHQVKMVGEAAQVKQWLESKFK